ncbi:hypothetical protein [Streptomyces sp. NPDC060243]
MPAEQSHEAPTEPDTTRLARDILPLLLSHPPYIPELHDDEDTDEQGGN